MTGIDRVASRESLCILTSLWVSVVPWAGCGGPDGAPPTVAASATPAAEPDEPEVDRRKVMDNLREVLVAFQNENNRGPLKVTDLDKYRSKWPAVCSAVGSGKVMVVWGRRFEPRGGGGGNLLAYEKRTAASGGLVMLQQDGRVLAITADQFKNFYR